MNGVSVWDYWSYFHISDLVEYLCGLGQYLVRLWEIPRLNQ